MIKPLYKRARSFSGGLAAVWVGGRIGYIDKTGKTVIKPQFVRAWDFVNGHAPVEIGEKWGYIDKSGEVVIGPRFDAGGYFRNGLARVNVGGVPDADDDMSWTLLRAGHLMGYWGFIDRTGRYVLQPTCQLLLDHSPDGLAAVLNRSKMGLKDRDGKVVVKAIYEHIDRFSGGMAVFVDNGKYGFLDSKGKVAIKPRFDWAEPFSGGKAKVRLGKETFWIDCHGRQVSASLGHG